MAVRALKANLHSTLVPLIRTRTLQTVLASQHLHSTLVPLIRKWGLDNVYSREYLHSTLVPLILSVYDNLFKSRQQFTFYFSSFNSICT